MRQVLKSLLVVAGLSADCAGAAPWSTIARNAESVVEIDSGSLARSGQAVRAWSRQIYGEDQDLPLGDPPFRAVRYLYNYECSKRTALLIRRTYVDEQGHAIKDQLLDGLEMARDIVPGTLQERVYDYACKESKSAETVAQKPSRTPAAQPDADAEQAADEPDANPADHADKADEAKGQGEQAKSAKGEKSEKHGDKSLGKAGKGKQAEEDGAREERAPKTAKPKHLPKAKLAKDDDQAGEGERDADHDADRAAPKPARKPEKVAMLDKGTKHDLDEKCDNCEQEEDKGAEQKPAKGAPHVRWEYDGKHGPQNWAKLSPDFATCGAGKFQSPIDVKEGIRLSLDPISFSYKPSQLRILDNGHTVQVNYGPGSSLMVNGEKFSLLQFHFHKPAEERIEGKSFDMVVHLVHKNVSGSLAVVAVMLRNGAPNPLIQTLWTHLPLMQGKEGVPKDIKIDASQLLPPDRSYYTFLGSLTTPPCTEGVLWMVMKNPMQVSRSQISAFGRLYEVNARPVQPTNRRLIKESL